MSDNNIGIRVEVEWANGLTRFDFDTKKLKKTFRIVGRDLKANASLLLKRPSPSLPGEIPGRLSGAYSRAVVAKVSRSGFSVGVSPTRAALLKAITKGKKGAWELKTFYPAILANGSVKRKIASRKSPTMEALDRRQAAYRSVLSRAIDDAIKPAFEK